jgi:hypothetical protein
MLGHLPAYAACSSMHFQDFGTREPATQDKHCNVWSFKQKQFTTGKQFVAEDEDYVFV